MYSVLLRACLVTLVIFSPITCTVPTEQTPCDLEVEDISLVVSSALGQGRSRSSRSKRDVDDIDVHEIVHLHNQVRAGVSPSASNMKYMSWNAGLAEKAQEYAEQCKGGHNPDLSFIGPGYTTVGENIYITTADQLNWFDAIGNWADEVGDYDIYNDTCKEQKVCGHYTQVVWADSYQLGCGVTKCASVAGMNDAILVICNYGPRGNFIGRRPYVLGERCSECRQGDNCSMGGLCSNPFRDSCSCVSVHPVLLMVCAAMGLLLWA
ncbi:glioma pathogenesis-related protein 1-like [Branchiostoma floridae]|uniref:Glioma pathogenesis-related protein 1-like n=1 Tax=Branchiostoma floridae TaxID=7739 RepID=A0A9J7L4M1_BRAFL|nr:glioma pathogenesis-related protein 1-like [Branchiostoma floridae]